MGWFGPYPFEVEHVHWSDVMAKRLAERGDTHIVATGITPSGEFHIGHLREILTGDMIARAARRAGMNAELVFVVDNADPLRKVYPFLDDAYEAFIGHQLGSIPAPDAAGKPDWDRYNNEGWTYADHFLTPFLAALKQIGVTPRLLPNLEAYRSGKFSSAARIACDHPDAVREIIERVSGRELPESWFPWQPLDSTGSLDGLTVWGMNFRWFTGRTSTGNRVHQTSKKEKVSCPGDWTGPPNGDSTPSRANPLGRTTAPPEAPTTPEKNSLFCSVINPPSR